MFTKNDFLAIANTIKHANEWYRYLGYAGLYYVIYPQFAFKAPDSEETICITRAKRKPGENGLLFWLAASLMPGIRFPNSGINRLDNAKLCLMDGAFQPIDEFEANRLVRNACESLNVDLQLPLVISSPFKGALMMRSMETGLEVSLIIEYEDEFVDFFWQSTA